MKIKIQRYLAALLVAPTFLALIQSCSDQTPTSELSESKKIILKTRPAVVRIIKSCYQQYSWAPSVKGEPKKQKELIKFDLGTRLTGFLIDSDGYIVTSAPRLYQTITREQCQIHIDQNIKNKLLRKFQENDPTKSELQNLVLSEKHDRDKFERYLKTHGNLGTLYYTNGVLLLPNTTDSNDISRSFNFIASNNDNNHSDNSNDVKDITIIKIPVEQGKQAPTIDIPQDNLDSFKPEIQDHFLAIGYPIIADINETKIDSTRDYLKSYSQISITDGRISSTQKQMHGESVIQLDVPSLEISAGSPLINDKGQLIGMIAWSNQNDKKSATGEAQDVPTAIDIKTILDSIVRHGVPHRSGLTNKYYNEALESFSKANYDEAKAKFYRVRGLFHSHSEVGDLLSQINTIQAEMDAIPLWKKPIFLYALASASVVAALAYFLLRRKSSARQTSSGSPGGSVLKTPDQGNGAGTPSWLEIEYKGQTRQLPLSKDEHHLGRDPQWSDVTIPISWEVISRKQAILHKEGEDYRIYDGDRNFPSSNGLWINDDIRVDLQEGHLLKNGDQLKISKNAHEQVILTYYNSSNQAAQLIETKMHNN